MKLISVGQVETGYRTESYTNLGAGFTLSIGGATEVTVHRAKYHKGGPARIVWVNTYGNVTANNGRFGFTPAGQAAADKILETIERGSG